MALVDRDRRYVAANDAAADLYQYRREDVIGSRTERTALADDPHTADAEWEQLLQTNELYSERLVELPSGARMHISFAAHGTSVIGRWLALCVTHSARLQPDGAELVASVETDRPGHPRSKLTPREREVVRRVALGASTRRIAAGLFLSPATVRTHVRNAMVKTDAHTRAQLVAIVLGDGMIREPTGYSEDSGPRTAEAHAYVVGV